MPAAGMLVADEANLKQRTGTLSIWPKFLSETHAISLLDRDGARSWGEARADSRAVEMEILCK